MISPSSQAASSAASDFPAAEKKMSAFAMPHLRLSSTSGAEAASAPRPSPASARTTGGKGLALMEYSRSYRGKAWRSVSTCRRITSYS